MPRTRKTLSKQNLATLPVLINDTAPESLYFNIKQLSGVFSGGRNAFLISGTSLLKPNTEVLIEIIDSNGNSLYVEAIKGFVEGSARLVVVEVYENTPRGSALLSIVGTARINAETNTALPNNAMQSPNVRWQKKLIIEPRNENTTRIRLKKQPEVLVTELQATASLLSQSFIQNGANFTLTPKTVLGSQRGYVVMNGLATPFASSQKEPKITGSLFLETRTYKISIPPTTSSYTVIASETASVDLSLTLVNNTASLTDANITGSVSGKILNITPLLSGTYQLTSSAYSASATEYVQTVSLITSSVRYNYISESILQTSESLSLAKLRIINLDTVSGQIYRVKTSNKSAASNLEFVSVADTPTLVGEILVTGSQVVNEREVPIGVFTTNDVLTSNWYAHLTTGSAIPNPSYFSSSVSSSFHLPLVRSDNIILDGGYALTTSSSYFFGTKNSFSVFQNSEYTLQFNADAYTTSGSIVSPGEHTVDIYIVGSAVPSTDPLGQKIGTITTNEESAYFPNRQYNFTVPRNGNISIRFVVHGGFWQFGNISLKVAQEYAFSPDEVTILLLNENKFTDLVEYKTDFYDINNNALSISTISVPTYFTGSRKYVLRSGDNMWGNLTIERGGIEVTGSSNFTGSLSVSSGSSFNLVSGSEMYRWGHKLFNYGHFYSTASQNLTAANTAYSASLTSTAFARGIRIVSGSRIVVENTGYYNLQFSAQLDNTANNTIIFDIWFAKDQVNIENSNTIVEIDKQPATTGRTVASWNFMEYLQSGSYLEIRMAADQTTGRLLYAVSSSLRPATPSLIVTMDQIA